MPQLSARRSAKRIMAWVYILKDDSDRYYIGSTDDIDRRLVQHLQGHTQTTRNMKNPKLVLKQEVGSLQEARSIERKIKNMKRKDYIVKIVSDGYIRLASRSSMDRTGLF